MLAGLEHAADAAVGKPPLGGAAERNAMDEHLLPCERFTSDLADSPCITRGRCGSLLLHRDGLPPSTSCRSPGAPVRYINALAKKARNIR